jgi:hypothetical protein
MQLLQLLVACQDKADAGAVHKGDLFKIKLYRFGLIFFYQVDADLLEIANGKVIQIPVKIKVKDTVNILMFHVSSLRPSSYHVFICLWGYSTKHPEVRQNKRYPLRIRVLLYDDHPVLRKKKEELKLFLIKSFIQITAVFFHIACLFIGVCTDSAQGIQQNEQEEDSCNTYDP